MKNKLPIKDHIFQHRDKSVRIIRLLANMGSSNSEANSSFDHKRFNIVQDIRVLKPIKIDGQEEKVRR
ncbi:MAG: hypothetical protein WA144_14225 [Candidatus Methanoperedens sp.]